MKEIELLREAGNHYPHEKTLAVLHKNYKKRRILIPSYMVTEIFVLDRIGSEHNPIFSGIPINIKHWVHDVKIYYEMTTNA